MSGFEAFTEAVASTTATKQAVSGPALDRVAILGGGSDACLLAALALASDVDVHLFSAYGAELETLRTSSGISLRGAGPVGTYQVDRKQGPSVQTTAELDRAIVGADAIFLTGPVHKYRTYAMVLADHLVDGQIIVLPEGRSLGALEVSWLLRVGGCTADVTIVELQGLPYWIDAQGAVLNLSSRSAIPAATLPSNRPEAITRLARLLPDLDVHPSVLASGFADGSALVELPVLLMANDPVALPVGATPLPENDCFAGRLNTGHHNVISRLADERRAVGRAFGVRNMPDTDVWVARYAGASRGEGARRLPAAATPILRDGVIGSFVPLISAADLSGTDVPMTRALVTLASTVLSADVATAGRRLETIGVRAADVDTARQTMDAIARGRH